jgi:multicomponent K+:H+ antiporter subunit A
VVALLGELPLATAALFDLGVYLTVVASTLLTLSALGAASEDAVDPVEDAEVNRAAMQGAR